ncbi:mobilization protein [Campylobacter sp. MIT 12-5580]|uniref:relaxase/mobilization nuclease domain-containing protein n=1 Tax=Campylobacter sp. MIT 12-5580 TaxID=2040651 RepID=UPI0010F9EB29|nr:relaxase/mobilization nuclease domain-containing protein [Campylobacter sp. MIT 12-5580]TKX28071.1 mobilization protein [Campylobacter sp. MIT 12-5580]
MIVKFFATKKGGGVSSINYLLDKRTQLGTARILQGNAETTKNLIKAMSQKHKTCMGCLSFEEQNISEELKKELMQSFENALLTPAMQGRYNILWVEHTDKGRLELNFIIPKIDLESKKALNPYFHMADKKRIEIWQDLSNLNHNFTNPKDPAKQNTIQGSKKQKELFSDYEALDKLLTAEVMQGNIKSRDHLISLLKTQEIEITRQGKDYISIKLPNSQKAKRFKGGIYDEKFRSLRDIEAIYTRAREQEQAYNQRDNRAILAEYRAKLDEQIKRKTEFYDELIKRQAEQSSKRARERSFGNAEEFQRLAKQAIERNAGNELRADEIQTHRANNQLFFGNGDYGITFSNDLQIKADNDSTRTRIMQRNRDLTARARENAEQRSRTLQGFKQSNSTTRENERKQQELIRAHRERETRSRTRLRGVEDQFSNEAQQFNRELRSLSVEYGARTFKIRGSINRTRDKLAGIRELVSTKFAELADKFTRAIRQHIQKVKERQRQRNRGFSR